MKIQLDSWNYGSICKLELYCFAYNCRQQLMYAAGVHGFSITDLMAPEPGRLRAILSAVANFCKFREARVSLFNELKDQSVLFNFILFLIY
jgi:hypothetical protein